MVILEKEPSTAAEDKSFDPHRFFSQIEQYHCPCCDGAIAKECVAGNVIQSSYTLLPKRCVRVLCEHCDKVFQATFTLSGGFWAISESPREVTSQRVIEGMKRRVSAFRGDVTC